MNEIIPQDSIADFENTQKLCTMLLKAPHYAKIGPEGIFAIIETAKGLGIDPKQALNGGLFYVKGKVEMSARMMNATIRSRGHSITKDKNSSDTCCILHGKRCDTGDTWSESFSIKEATAAGLVRSGGPWVTFPRDMLFARALSRLARQLFPDVIGSVYVEGEISLDPNISEKPNNSFSLPVISESSFEPVEVIDISPSEEQVKILTDIFQQLPEYEEKIGKFLLDKGFGHYTDMPMAMFEKILKNAEIKLQEKNGT
jgi:hypothetical protein